MHMTIRHHRVPTERAEEVTRRVDTDWIEKMSRQPGFVSAYAVRLEEVRLTFVTAFVDESTARKGVEASVAWVSQRLMDQDVELEDEWEGPVVAHAGQD
jgi:hypothetical protein